MKMHCEDEVKMALENETQYDPGPSTAVFKGNAFDDSSAFIVQDDNYISARWPGGILIALILC
jgi:hypothetical protein